MTGRPLLKSEKHSFQNAEVCIKSDIKASCLQNGNFQFAEWELQNNITIEELKKSEPISR